MKYRILYFILVIIALVAYLVSLVSPLITVKKLLFFSDTITFMSILSTLRANGELVLLVVIFVFTIVLPTLKFLLLINVGLNPEVLQTKTKFLVVLEQISKWAMLDVFIAALIIVIVKLEILSSAYTHYGLYLFIASVLLSMVCSQTQRYWLFANSHRR